jgi:hypothetical protein
MSGKLITIPFYPQNYQREILEDKSRFKVIIRGRRGGKTEEELQGMIMDAVTNPGRHWLVGPSYRQIKSIAWTRLKAILDVDKDWIFNEQELYAHNPNIIDEKGTPTRMELKGADKEDSLVGVALKSLRMDEAALIRGDVWSRVLRPMLADYRAPAYFYSTPRGRNWLYDLYMRGVNGDAGWKSWRQPTSINTYITAEEISESKRDMSEMLFAQEFMAEFLSDDTGVFKRIRQCIVGKYKAAVPGRFYVMGVDLAKTVDFTVLTVVDSVTREVVAWERFQDLSWSVQKLRIQELAARYNNALCVIDSTGVGDPIVEDLQRCGLSLWYDGDKPGFRFSNSSKSNLINNLAIAIEQRRITFPDEPILIDELMSFEYAITDGGKITYSAPDGKHDDTVISLALAIWPLKSQLAEAAVVQRMMVEEGDRQGHGELIESPEFAMEYRGY